MNNTICPYCCTRFVSTENNPKARSREHLIAERFFKTPRGMGHADFYACRECNSNKSKMDYIFAAVSRMQSGGHIAVDEVENILQDQKKINRFLNYFRNSEKLDQGSRRVPFPATYEDTLSYIMYLAKGLYFIKKGKVLNERKMVVVPTLACRGSIDEFGKIYNSVYNTNCFDDLRTNPLSRILGNGEATTLSRGKEHIVTLNDTIIIHTYIFNRSAFTRRKRREALKMNFHHLRGS